jgi:hypothetical protein
MVTLTFFFLVLGLEPRALHLVDQCSALEAKPPVLFCLVTFQIGWHNVCPPAWTLWSSYLHFLSSWDDRHILPPPAYWLVWRGGGLTHFCPGWSQTTVLPISTSQVVRITGGIHCALPTLTFKETIFQSGCTIIYSNQVHETFNCSMFSPTLDMIHHFNFSHFKKNVGNFWRFKLYFSTD